MTNRIVSTAASVKTSGRTTGATGAAAATPNAESIATMHKGHFGTKTAAVMESAAASASRTRIVFVPTSQPSH
jgi:hypothetical protein